MSADYFKFKQFVVHQDRCAMKVGTDGTLLGAWADLQVPGGRVLDIGTGTGLIALMIAQRFPEASIVAVDIDEMAVAQARENVSSSSFANRIRVIHQDVCEFDGEMKFDAIVSNPPYFEQSLESPDNHRTRARHTSSLSYATLIDSAYRLLSDTGIFSVIIPDDCKSRLMSECSLRGFFLARSCAIKTTPAKQAKRYLMEFRKSPKYEIITDIVVLEDEPKVRSKWYQHLTNYFYIK